MWSVYSKSGSISLKSDRKMYGWYRCEFLYVKTLTKGSKSIVLIKIDQKHTLNTLIEC